MNGPANAVRPFDVVTAPFGPGLSLVEAGAGTGKTFNLALSVVRLLLEGPADAPLVGSVGRILVVTFTNAATDELINRIRKVLRMAVDVFSGAAIDDNDATVKRIREIGAGKENAEERLRAALAAVDTLSVFTIHGFARRVLEEFALESGTPFGASLLENEDDLVREALFDWWRRTFYDEPSLARLAIKAKLGPDAFLSAYRTWCNWPGAAMAPAHSLVELQQELYTAVQAFVQVWQHDAFAERALGMAWNKGAPCATPEQIAEIDAAITLARTLRVGDPALLREIAPRIAPLTAEALASKATKRSNAQKAQVALLPEWPETEPAQRVAAVAERQLAALRADCIRAVERAVSDEKRRRHVFGFGDLLERLHDALAVQGPDGLLATTVRAQFDAALIDEFQDTDSRQFNIFTTIFAGRPLFLIGDPKQAIYGFRGADVQVYLEAANLTPVERRYSLQKNFRSTDDLVRAVNQLFARRTNPFLRQGIAYPPANAARTERPPADLTDGHALEVVWLDPDGGTAFTGAQAEQLSFVACVDEIVALLGAGWKPRHIAVLVRTGREGRAIEALLREANVPAVASGMDDVFRSREVDELHRLLQAIAAPRNTSLVRAALATELWGATHDDLVSMLAPDAEFSWDALLNELAVLRDRWVRDGLVSMIERCFAERRVYERLLPLIDGDRRITNLRHAVELIHGAAVDRQLNIDGVLRWLATERVAEHTEADAVELRLETDADAVQIVTIHKSKGLEYDIVFCPTLWNARLQLEAPIVVQEAGGTVFEHGSDRLSERLVVYNAKRLAEDLRLLYVALTRARFRTYATWGPVVKGNARERDAVLRADGSIHSALGFLLLVDETVDTLPPQDVPMYAANALLDAMDSMPAHLRALAKRSEGRVAIRPVRGAIGGARWAPPEAPTETLEARTLPAQPGSAERFRTYAMTSYTALTHAKVAESLADDQDDAARDIDANVSQITVPLVSNAEIKALPRSDFRAFPAGPREGTVLHRLFETSRFDDTNSVLRPRVARTLAWNHLADADTDERIDAVVEMMRAVYDAPVPLLGAALSQVAHARVRHEWQFTLPLASADAPLSMRRLASAFRESQDPALRAYADQVQQLNARRVFGFLQGFVDLLFEHNGRWMVVDWKSNRLPLDPSSFEQESLRAVMESHHYILQAHLYLVAVHRFLRSRVPSYDISQLGGASYAFLRGFAPGASSTGHGWFTMPTEPVVIDALDRALSGVP